MRLPSGKHILPEKTENFFKVCKELNRTFTGFMILSAKIHEKQYQAHLLIEDGKIIGASLTRLKDNKENHAETALIEIKDKMAGSRGDLDIYEYQPEELIKARGDNPDTLLDTPISVTELKVRVIAKKKPIPQKEKTSILSKFASIFKAGDEERKRMRAEELRKPREKKPEPSGGDELKAKQAEARIMAKSLAIKAQKEGHARIPDGYPHAVDFSDEVGKSSGFGVPSVAGQGVADREELKRQKIEEIRQRRQSKISKIKLEKKPEEKESRDIEEGEKVETTIDKLYELVIKYNRIKINDALSTKLGIQKSQIEEWSLILEEHNLVELHYPAIGEPEIRKIVEKEA